MLGSIEELLRTQLLYFSVKDTEYSIVKQYLPKALQRSLFSFKHNPNKYFKHVSSIDLINPYHSGQWCTILYYLSNTVYSADCKHRVICDKLYYLNKMLNGCDLFYEVELPDIFFLDHPVGSVLGRAIYSNYFSFSQGCTIGNNKGVYPKINENVRMLSNSKIIGDSIIGENVIISANCYVKDTNIPNDSIVFGQSPNLVIKPMKSSV